MVALLLMAAQQTPPSPTPCYDGSADFATALQRASIADPKFLDTVRPFGLAYWIGRLQVVKEFRGSYFVHETLVCGTMIELWDGDLGSKVREFALTAIVQNLDTEMPSVLQSDIQLAYVDLIKQYTKKDDRGSAHFDAGARLSALTPHLMFAEFIDLAKLKDAALPDLKACGQFATDHPNAPEALKSKLAEIGAKADFKPFSVLTVRDVGLLHAQALALTVPEKYRWKIPPDPPKVGG